MGGSDKLVDSGLHSYSLVQHRDYLDTLLEKIGLRQNVTLVVHDWGSARRSLSGLNQVAKPLG
jgi:haloalkane dehalogenase